MSEVLIEMAPVRLHDLFAFEKPVYYGQERIDGEYCHEYRRRGCPAAYADTYQHDSDYEAREDRAYVA